MEDKKKKVFISGKMSELDSEFYKSEFKRAEKYLIDEGYEPVNPCNLAVPSDYAGQLLVSLGELAKCDAIFLMNNWVDSNGARCEYWFAKGMGIEVINDDYEVDNEVQELESAIETLEDRITALLSNDDNKEDSIENLLERATKYHDYVGEVDEGLTDFVDRYMGYGRNEMVEYDTVLFRLKEELEDENVTKEKYDSMIEWLYEDVKEGYMGFKWDW